MMQYSGIQGVSKEAAEIMAHAAELFCVDLMKKARVITELYERDVVLEKDVNLCREVYPTIASIQDSVNEMTTDSMNRIKIGTKEDANDDVIQEPKMKVVRHDVVECTNMAIMNMAPGASCRILYAVIEKIEEKLSSDALHHAGTVIVFSILHVMTKRSTYTVTDTARLVFSQSEIQHTFKWLSRLRLAARKKCCCKLAAYVSTYLHFQIC
ncbi:hypothetical protein D917_05796 [Trichinella nativa]|uniref:Transcription factor CBF/NF-Y/archaeal histone domain-containing protein n=1 Tax=Trichinella nativa TaxID=6335 RepID=A0A1Y3EV14_9BILA|nr:hypothetical protein D917_05796 [Trichinella nativa]